MVQEIGSLDIIVKDAVQLPTVNHVGKQNPFAILAVGTERKQTKTHYSGHRHPVWGDRLSFTLEAGITSFSLDVYHESTSSLLGNRSTFIGTATVRLDQVLEIGSCTTAVRVGESGQVRLQLSFSPVTASQRSAPALPPDGQSRGSLPSGLSSRQLRQSAQPLETPGPPRLSRASPVKAKIQPVHDSRAESSASGSRTDSPVVANERPASSPSKSLRRKVGSKLGNFLYGRDSARPSVDITSNLTAKPSGLSDREAQLQSNTTTQPSDSLSENTSEDVTEHRIAEVNEPYPAKAVSVRRLPGPLEGAQSIAPGEGSGSGLGQAASLWQPEKGDSIHTTWEQRFEQNRRASDCNPAGNPSFQLRDRRQTDSGLPSQNMQLERDTGFGGNGSTRYYQLQEWESHGQAPPIPRLLGSLEASGSSRPQDWDISAQHERMMSNMLEVSRSVSTQPNFTDSALRSSSAQRWPGNKTDRDERFSQALSGLVTEARRTESDTLEDDKEELCVENSKRSDSAPPGGSAFEVDDSSKTQYPQPQYDDEDDIALRFSSLLRPDAKTVSPLRPASTHGAASATASSREAVSDGSSADANARKRDARFDDTSYVGSRENTDEAQVPPAEPTSFVGLVSPFAVDTSPLPVDPAPTISGSVSGSKSTGSRVPMRAVRQEMEAGAEGSARIAIRTSSGTDDSQKSSLALLLTESDKDWLIKEKELEIVLDEKGRPMQLGQGAFGTVYKGSINDTEVAIKSIKFTNEKELQSALAEVAILKKQLHPNIVQFLGASIGEGSIHLVTELLARNLYTALSKGDCMWHKGGKEIARHIAIALLHLHKKNVLHLDVKSANVLLTTYNVAKLADLGLSAMMNQESLVTSLKGLGTLQWSSPEVLLGSAPVTCASDVFSFGVVVWEICTGEIPVRGRMRPIDPNEAPFEIDRFVRGSVNADPKKRPTMQNFLEILKKLYPELWAVSSSNAAAASRAPQS